jgi:hypothetical protein
MKAWKIWRCECMTLSREALHAISFPEPAILGKEREALGNSLPEAGNPG